MTIHECRLVLHKKNKANDDDVLFCAKDFPDIKSGSLLELYHSEKEKHHLVRVSTVNNAYQVKDTISIDQHLALSFKFQQNRTIRFKPIDENLITLDVLDLILKDQYLNRSDMYMVMSQMRRSIIQVGKKVEFGHYRGTVGEIWCRGKRISTGYVGPNTRVVFRSATAVVHIFVQMSEEMWEFDYFGELYFDKAISFVSELFNKWNDNNCGHDVTIVLFSRVFFRNITEDKMDRDILEHLKVDTKGRYYEDFYCVVVQNERYMIAEWRKVIKTLKTRFNNYKAELQEFQESQFQSTNEKWWENSYLSLAEDANFLETLNVVLNLYENYYIDRNFDRTGKICVVITAGSGVYNVDRVQTNMTKQRICDLGTGIDLVCLGEQPLHTVPLFNFHQKFSPVDDHPSKNDFYIPYWINHSFYRSVNELQAIQLGKFIPRIKVKIETIDQQDHLLLPKTNQQFDSSNNSYICNLGTAAFSKSPNLKPQSTADSMTNMNVYSTSNDAERGSLLSAAVHESFGSKDDSYIHSARSIQWKTSQTETRKELFNPFMPNRLNVHSTSNSRRWSHVFPIDKNNIPIKLHHKLTINYPTLGSFESKKPHNMHQAWKNYYKLYLENNKKDDESSDSTSSPNTTTRDTSQIVSPKSLFYEPDDSAPLLDNVGSGHTSEKVSDNSSAVSPLPSSYQGPSSQRSRIPSLSGKGSLSRRIQNVFENDQKRNWENQKENDSPINHMEIGQPFRLIGVDWKSLTLPAILPITSDHYPSKKTLEQDFLESNYQLMPTAYDPNLHGNRKPLTINQVFQELIYQRLNQGFQLIVNPPSFSSSSHLIPVDGTKKMMAKTVDQNSFRLSIGRIYHWIQLKQDQIYVKQYIPRHHHEVKCVRYNYCLKMPDSVDYMVSRTKFTIQMLENFNWNYYDRYILNYGGNIISDIGEDSDLYPLIPSQKFWRSRFFLIPTYSATKTIMDFDKNSYMRCDIYEDKSVIERNTATKDFFKFMEVINKIKRRASNSKTKTSVPLNEQSFVGQSLFKVKSVCHGLDTKFTFDSCDSAMKDNFESNFGKLSDTSPYSKVVEAMADKDNGLSFLPSNEYLGEYSFTAYECVNWCITNIDRIDNVKDAVAYLQKLLDLKYICHASKCWTHKFIYGFIFYCLKVAIKDSVESIPQITSSSLTNLNVESIDSDSKAKSKRIEYAEVSLASIESESDKIEKKIAGFHLQEMFRSDSPQNTEFLMEKVINRAFENLLTTDNFFELTGNSYLDDMIFEDNGVLYKKVILDVETDGRDRPEWGVFQYQANYHPDAVFEFMVQWVVATGAKLAEKINQWSRKISVLQLIPVPCDPFALPSSENSDPLRGPIFVPLNVIALLNSKKSNPSIREIVDDLFEDFPKDQRLIRLLLMQEVILKRFGFIRETCANYRCSQYDSQKFKESVSKSGTRYSWSYVHCSGGMFCMIPSYCTEQSLTNSGKHSVKDCSTSVGFLWSWNKMLTRKLPTSSVSVDEVFQDRMLADFRDFCSNTSDRLQIFYTDARKAAVKRKAE